MKLPQDIYRVYKNATCLYTKEQVEQALDRLAQEIRYNLEDKNPVLLTVMVGGMIPAAHLLTRIDFPLELDYAHATRYQSGVEGKELIWKNEPSTKLKERTVLILDDILDGGLTLMAVKKYCEAQGTKQVQTAVLVDKQGTRLEGGLAKADYTGLTIEDYYVFGYGMDYYEYLRNAPGIYAVSTEDL
ncbi:MAG: hypoxanthine-guanine phosphoribosyltransferase [Pseudomonadota bacterium]